jgi:hypothetical protein
MDTDLLKRQLRKAKELAVACDAEIERQKALIAKIERTGVRASGARQVLKAAQQRQVLLKAEVARLTRELGNVDADPA